MRPMSTFNAVAAAGLALMLQSGAAMAQALETVGAPVARGLGHQPAGSDMAIGLQWLDNVILIIISAIVGFVCLLLLIASRMLAADFSAMRSRLTIASRPSL